MRIQKLKGLADIFYTVHCLCNALTANDGLSQKESNLVVFDDKYMIQHLIA